MDIAQLKKKLQRRIDHSKRRNDEKCAESGIEIGDLPTKFTYWGGFNHGYTSGRLEGLMMAMDVIEELEDDL